MGAGGHGGFGNTGGAKEPQDENKNPRENKPKSTIEGNAEKMKKDYPYKNGKFGEKGKNAQLIKSNDPEGTSVDFYKKLGAGGKTEPLPNGYGTMTTLDDGTVITHRINTSTPNSPAVDINVSNSPVIKTQKIHFIKEDD